MKISEEIIQILETEDTKLELSEDFIDFLNYMNNFIQTFFDIKTKNKVSVNKRNHSVLCFSNKILIKSMKIFAIKHNLPIMERKWNKINENI